MAQSPQKHLNCNICWMRYSNPNQTFQFHLSDRLKTSIREALSRFRSLSLENEISPNKFAFIKVLNHFTPKSFPYIRFICTHRITEELRELDTLGVMNTNLFLQYNIQSNKVDSCFLKLYLSSFTIYLKWKDESTNLPC